MHEPTMFTLHDGPRTALELAEATEGEMAIADIRTLLALKFQADMLSRRIDGALVRDAVNA